jgi:hypothetical protein
MIKDESSRRLLMRVLHVIPSVSRQAGGPSEAIFPMCRALRRKGVEVVLATTDEGVDISQFACEQDYRGLPVIFFRKQLGRSFKYSRPFADWLNASVTGYDIVHIHAVFNHACIAAARACR